MIYFNVETQLICIPTIWYVKYNHNDQDGSSVYASTLYLGST
jgi:hypothetical protein